jgi:hypothetical protein
MDQQRSTFVAIGLALIVLAIIGGTIYYLISFIRGRQSGGNNQPTVSASVTPTGNPNFPTKSPQVSTASVRPSTSVKPAASTKPSTSPLATPSSNSKVHNGEGFAFSYPKEWGILTCNNSGNFEFDPANSSDNLEFNCNYAVKPVTVIVYENQISCPGQQVKVGQIAVYKSTSRQGGVTNYRWCTKTTPAFDITHRVSTISTSPAYSRVDYSSQIEEMISKINTASAS